MKNFLLSGVLFLAACGNAPVENRKDSTAADSLAAMTDTTLPRLQSSLLDTISMKANTALIQQDSVAIAKAMSENVPGGWEIMDTMTGDLNRDKYSDLLIVLSRVGEFGNDSDLVRPLLILTGNSAGELIFRERNDNVVLCYHCGGVMGDPYDGLAIRNGYFSVQHYGGSSWRWSKIITFRYNESQKTWFLHRDAGESFNVFEIDSVEPREDVFNQDQYGKMKFVEYTYD